MVITRDDARAIAGSVPDPELDPLTIDDLGMLRDVELVDGRVTVWLAPTYAACPALEAVARRIRDELLSEGVAEVDVRIALDAPWRSDAITIRGRRKLAAVGVAPPEASARCPRCGANDTAVIAPFGAAPCRSLHRCSACGEPFEQMKTR